jgi:uncharacterized SAM-dependent methyltransferase
LAQTKPVQIGEDRLVIHNLVKQDPSAGFPDDVRKGLSSEPKRLLPKYFYDELGSLLFDAICLLPEYYLTRAENEIIERYAGEIVNAVDGYKTLLEMGSGSASKTKLIVEALLNQHEICFLYRSTFLHPPWKAAPGSFCNPFRACALRLMPRTISIAWRL